MIRVSVLITFYNQFDYVDKAIQSVLNQKTNFQYEIIVGDDGSDDGTIEAVQSWIAKYPNLIRIFIRDRNDGIKAPGFRASRNRLNLLQFVKGKYFIFLDGDDYFSDDEKLQKQVDVLENAENKDCIACSHIIEALYPDGHSVALPKNELTERKVELKEYWKNLYFHTDTTLIRSDVIPKIPADYVINNFNDNLITYIIIQHGKFYYLPEEMAVYLQTGDGIWTSKKQIINHIRNIFLYDICNAINPDVEKLTGHRFFRSWLYLIRHFTDIRNTDLKEYRQEALRSNLQMSQVFLNYDEISVWKKVIFWFKTLRLCTTQVGFKLCSMLSGRL